MAKEFQHVTKSARGDRFFLCTACNSHINLSTRGTTSIVDHQQKTKKHKNAIAQIGPVLTDRGKGTGFGSDRDGIIRDRHYNHPSQIMPQNIAYEFGHVPHDLRMSIEPLQLSPTYNEMNEALPIYTVLNSGDVSNIGSNRGAGGGAKLPLNYRANEALSLSAFPVLNSSDVKAHGTGRLGQDDNRDSNKGKQRKLAEKHNAKQTVQFKKKKETKPSKSPEH